MIEGMGFLVSYLGFGAIGFAIGRGIKRPANTVTFAVLVLLTMFSQELFSPHAVLIGLGRFTIYMNWAIQPFFGGMLVGLYHSALKRGTSAAS